MPLEVAVFSSSSALQAQSLGAHRIELNAPHSYPVGGLTPPLTELTSIAPQLQIPVRVMIRPRGGDFFYTESEVGEMLHAVHEFKSSGVMDPVRGDGFVFGLLTRAGAREDEHAGIEEEHGEVVVDETRCKMLVAAASPFPCVFHRAFDPVASTWSAGLNALIDCGFHGLLTAGGQGGAERNAASIADMRAHVGARLQVVAGGGVRSHNVARLARGNGWVHTASLAEGETLDGDELLRIMGSMGGLTNKTCLGGT